MDELARIWLGLGFLGLVVILLGIYVIWETHVRGGKIRRVADEDKKLIENGKMTEAEVVGEIKSLVGPGTSGISALAGITMAAVFIVIALSISGEIEFGGSDTRLILAKKWILYSVLALMGVAAILWLFILEQLSQMNAPSITNKRLLKFHRYNNNLWLCGMILVLLALYLFLMLAHVYVAMVAGFATACIVVGYWRIHNGWDEKREQEETES